MLLKLSVWLFPQHSKEILHQFHGFLVLIITTIVPFLPIFPGTFIKSGKQIPWNAFRSACPTFGSTSFSAIFTQTQWVPSSARMVQSKESGSCPSSSCSFYSLLSFAPFSKWLERKWLEEHRNNKKGCSVCAAVSSTNQCPSAHSRTPGKFTLNPHYLPGIATMIVVPTVEPQGGGIHIGYGWAAMIREISGVISQLRWTPLTSQTFLN